MRKDTREKLFQLALFIATFITTTIAGSEWCYGSSVFSGHYTWNDFTSGLEFSIPLLLILTVHEFGHYFMAMYHRVRTSLPYYIPIPPIPFLPLSIGTMGAVIRLRDRPQSNLQNFDIGLAGPMAGFIVALLVMLYGFKTLPPPEHIFKFHPEYEQYGLDYDKVVYSDEYLKAHQPTVDVIVGSNILFWLFENTVADPSRVPNAHELMHYPILLAAYIALFVTCLNLLPIGQLDGGHVVYGLFGFKIHRIIASIFFIAILFYSGLGLEYVRPDLPRNELLVGIILYVAFLYFALRGLSLSAKNTLMYALLIFAIQFILMTVYRGIEGYSGWILFVFILGRFIGVQHPPSEIEQPLDAKRVVLGWITLLIFILCFSPAPITLKVIIEQ